MDWRPTRIVSECLHVRVKACICPLGGAQPSVRLENLLMRSVDRCCIEHASAQCRAMQQQSAPLVAPLELPAGSLRQGTAHYSFTTRGHHPHMMHSPNSTAYMSAALLKASASENGVMHTQHALPQRGFNHGSLLSHHQPHTAQQQQQVQLMPGMQQLSGGGGGSGGSLAQLGMLRPSFGGMRAGPVMSTGGSSSGSKRSGASRRRKAKMYQALNTMVAAVVAGGVDMETAEAAAAATAATLKGGVPTLPGGSAACASIVQAVFQQRLQQQLLVQRAAAAALPPSAHQQCMTATASSAAHTMRLLAAAGGSTSGTSMAVSGASGHLDSIIASGGSGPLSLASGSTPPLPPHAYSNPNPTAAMSMQGAHLAAQQQQQLDSGIMAKLASGLNLSPQQQAALLCSTDDPHMPPASAPLRQGTRVVQRWPTRRHTAGPRWCAWRQPVAAARKAKSRRSLRRRRKTRKTCSCCRNCSWVPARLPLTLPARELLQPQPLPRLPRRRLVVLLLWRKRGV